MISKFFAASLLAPNKPTLVVCLGLGKSMANRAAMAAIGQGLAVDDGQDVLTRLYCLDAASEWKALCAGSLAKKPYPKFIFLEIHRPQQALSAELLEAIGDVHVLLSGMDPILTQEESIVRRFLQESLRFLGKKPIQSFIYNADIPHISDAAEILSAKQTVTFSLDQVSDIQAISCTILEPDPSLRGVDTRWEGMHAKVLVEGSTLPLSRPNVFGRFSINASLAGLAVAKVLQTPLLDAIQSLRSAPLLPGRMSLLPGIKKTMLIDDTYSNTAAAWAQLLPELADMRMPDGKRKIAILGELDVLGAESEQVHAALGQSLAQAGFGVIVGVGERCRDLLRAAEAAGMPSEHLQYFGDNVEAGKFVQQILKKGEVVFIKGDARQKFESIVKELMAFPLQAKTDLLQR